MTAEEFYNQILLNQDAILSGIESITNMVNGILVVFIGLILYNLFWGSRK